MSYLEDFEERLIRNLAGEEIDITFGASAFEAIDYLNSAGFVKADGNSVKLTREGWDYYNDYLRH
jgi:superfamily II helicase